MKKAMERRDRVRSMLVDLKMPGALEAVDGILAKADSGAATATEAIEELLDAQIALRNNRRLFTAMRSSRLPAVKTLEQFDFSFQPSIRREQIESLHELGFVGRSENVIFLGASGSRKDASGDQPGHRGGRGRPTGLLRHALQSGRVVDRSPSRWQAGPSLEGPRPSRSPGGGRDRLPAREPGWRSALLPADQRSPRAGFDDPASNKGFEEWGGVLGDEVMASAMLDRLVHHSHIVNIRGNSYRMREHQALMGRAKESSGGGTG